MSYGSATSQNGMPISPRADLRRPVPRRSVPPTAGLGHASRGGVSTDQWPAISSDLGRGRWRQLQGSILLSYLGMLQVRAGMTIKRYWTSGEAQQITGASRGNLEYWQRTGLIAPTVATPAKRQWLFYGFDDLVRIRTVVELRERGASLQHIRQVLRRLHRLSDDPLRERRLVVFGKAVHLYDPEDQFLMRVLDGQTASTDLLIEDVAKQVEDAIVVHHELGREDIITRDLHAEEVA